MTTGAGGDVGMTNPIGPNTPVGTCATGFTRCYGICVEDGDRSAPSCRPALCAAPAMSATPPARPNLSRARLHLGRRHGGRHDDASPSCPASPASAAATSASSPSTLVYRVNGGPATQVATMTGPPTAGFQAPIPGVKAGDDLDFYFHTTVATQTIIVPSPNPGGKPLIDTMWFHQRIGSAARSGAGVPAHRQATRAASAIATPTRSATTTTSTRTSRARRST